MPSALWPLTPTPSNLSHEPLGQETSDALARLVDEDLEDPEGAGTAHLKEEQELEARIRLWEQRGSLEISMVCDPPQWLWLPWLRRVAPQRIHPAGAQP